MKRNKLSEHLSGCSHYIGISICSYVTHNLIIGISIQNSTVRLIKRQVINNS